MKANLDGLAEAARVVQSGGLICFPTDTVYGLGCDPLNASAVQRAVNAKGGRVKPMPVLVRNLETAGQFAHLSPGAVKLARKFWPGYLTMVLPAQTGLSLVLAPNQTIGLRSPKHAVCLELLGLCGGALVGTSANPTGMPPAVLAEEAIAQLGDRVDLVLDGGRAPMGIASTVVDLTGPKLLILREGPISRKEIMQCIREEKLR